MNKRLKTNLIIGGAVALVFFAVLWIATLYDFKISAAIAQLNGKNYYSDNFFGRFFETFGETPDYLFLGVSGGLILRALPEKISKGKILVLTELALIAFIIAVYSYMAKKVIGYISSHVESVDAFFDGKAKIWGVALVFGLAMSAATLLLTSKVKDEKLSGLFLWALLVLFAVAISQGVVQGIKPFVSRMRYRAIYVLNENGRGDLANFTEWYVWNGRKTVSPEMLALGIGKDAYKSFPSGHTCGGAIVFTLAFLPEFLKTEENLRRKYSIIIWVVTTVFVVVLAYSRILMGAHYLSDVLFGGYVAYIATLISKKIVKTLAKKFKLL